MSLELAAILAAGVSVLSFLRNEASRLPPAGYPAAGPDAIQCTCVTRI